MALLEAALITLNYKTGPERRVRVRFKISDPEINMEVQNTTPVEGGVSPTEMDDNTASSMKLIRKLVDNISIDQIAIGTTRIRLTSYLRASKKGPSNPSQQQYSASS